MISADTDGPAAPPRRNGELVFDAPWQGRAFGLCVAVLEREGLGWDAFRPHLVAALAADPDADYYDAFGLALEEFVTERGLTAQSALA
ncbi:MAG: nitrile hydratase subunit beta [Actinomycetota bacterium]|nr:nitrile hydratase subunit beta [Actinomycetota bacterium]